jgi:hypothetical protein
MINQSEHDVGFDVLTTVVMKISVFSEIMQSTSLKINRRFGGICRLHVEKTEAVCSSETLVDFQRNRRRYVPEDRNLKFEHAFRNTEFLNRQSRMLIHTDQKALLNLSSRSCILAQLEDLLFYKY